MQTVVVRSSLRRHRVWGTRLFPRTKMCWVFEHPPLGPFGSIVSVGHRVHTIGDTILRVCRTLPDNNVVWTSR